MKAKTGEDLKEQGHPALVACFRHETKLIKITANDEARTLQCKSS